MKKERCFLDSNILTHVTHSGSHQSESGFSGFSGFSELKMNDKNLYH